jgi:hypothetical protein
MTAPDDRRAGVMATMTPAKASRAPISATDTASGAEDRVAAKGMRDRIEIRDAGIARRPVTRGLDALRREGADFAMAYGGPGLTWMRRVRFHPAGRSIRGLCAVPARVPAEPVPDG